MLLRDILHKCVSLHNEAVRLNRMAPTSQVQLPTALLSAHTEPSNLQIEILPFLETIAIWVHSAVAKMTKQLSPASFVI